MEITYNAQSIGERIQELMKLYNLKESDFSRITDISWVKLSFFFTGRSTPSLSDVFKIMLAFPDVDKRWLVLGIGELQVDTGQFNFVDVDYDVENDVNQLVNRLKQVKRNFSKSYKDFEDKTGISTPTFQHVIFKRMDPSMHLILKICQAFPMLDPVWLLTGNGVEPVVTK